MNSKIYEQKMFSPVAPVARDCKPTRALPQFAATLLAMVTLTVTLVCTAIAFATIASDTYQQVTQSVEQGKIRTLAAVRQKLAQHPQLLPFVEYKVVSRAFSSLSDKQIEDFIDRHPDAVVSMLTRHKYLKRLAKKEQWQTFTAIVDKLPNAQSLSTTMRCRYFQAQLATGTSPSAIDGPIAEVWHSGRSLPESCDPVFAEWHRAGLLTTERALDRVGLTIDKNNIGLARFIARRYLDKTATSRVEDWINAKSEPEAVLSKYADVLIPLTSVSLVRYALTRAAWTSADPAPDVLDRWLPRLRLSLQDRDRVIEVLGRRAAANHKDYASRLLDRAAAENLRTDTPERHITAALREGRFDRAAELISVLPAEEYDAPRWQYWGARLAQKRGDKASANTVFSALAKTRNYYGFLSADRIGASYKLNDARADSSAIDSLLEQSGISMAQALLDADDEHFARRQWAYATRDLSKDDLQSAAVLAHRWKWHDRAIITMAKSGFFNDMTVRFPLLHRELIEQNARKNSLNPAWVYGVIRQESAFVTDARSSVGALGLMQLMPATGKRVAKRIGLKARSSSAILNYKNNIQLGSAYLRELLDQCGHAVLATASYNAGPRRIKRWLPKDGNIDAEIWIETIPYPETRGFVKNVLSFTAVYEQRLGGKQRRLADKLAPIRADAC